jgi:undecaprenyl phosphate N,N'-diacetylbacillosamine 1-phosphate transferase
MYPDSIKRLFDLLFSSIAFVILLPLFLLLCLFLYFRNNGRPFFLQVRPGFHEIPFKVIKFKTMTDAKDSEGNLLPNHLRITNVGKFLRKYSLDELPQLINVIKGDMSLVGPRPLLFKYIPLYSEEQRKRHLVKPGITGWAQVNGRNAISWTKKFEYDVWYVENISLLLDLKIFIMTVLKILKSEGINAGENLTMPPFNGKN